MSILLKTIFLPQDRPGLLVLMGEEGLEARAEIDVPAPETAHQ